VVAVSSSRRSLAGEREEQDGRGEEKTGWGLGRGSSSNKREDEGGVVKKTKTWMRQRQA